MVVLSRIPGSPDAYGPGDVGSSPIRALIYKLKQMKLVRENINFERNRDPKEAMKIGAIKIKRYPISNKEFSKGDTDRIENNMSLRNIFHQYFFKKDYIGPDGLPWGTIYLTQNNKDLFLKTFGKQDFVFTCEYKNYGWGFKFDNIILIVLTGNKGTSYEFKGVPTEKDEEALKLFFDWIIEESSGNKILNRLVFEK